MDQTPLPPQFTGSIAALGVVLGTASLLYTISKDKGIGAMRARAVENAKSRLAFWDQKLRIQSAALDDADLEKAKRAAVEAAENIHRELDENLETLRVWKGPPPVIVGLSWWRKLFLLYRPIHGVKWLGYLTRTCYLLTWLVMLMYLGIVSWAFVVFQIESPDKQAIDRAFLASPHGHAALLTLLTSCLSMIWNGALFYRTVRHEKSTRRFKELERI